MKKRLFFTYMLTAMLIVSLVIFCTSCGSDKNASEETTTVEAETTDIIDGEENIVDDGDASRDSDEAFNEKLVSKAEKVTNSDAKILNGDKKNFFGSWSATSEKAKYFYGNLDISINEDGTFTANITEEDISGTWTKTDYGIHFDSESFYGIMYYGDGCKMILDEDDMKIVMKKR